MRYCSVEASLMTWSTSYRRRAGAHVIAVLTLLGILAVASSAAHAALSFAARATFATAAFPRSTAIADLNGDGVLDLVVANEGVSPGPGSVSVLLASAPGTYLAAVDYAADDFPSDLVIADVNGDGTPDILVVNLTVATLSVLLGNGDGTFAPRVDYAAGAGAYALAVGDFNQDGLPDVAITNSGQSTVSVLLGSSGAPGTFPTRVEYATSADPTGLVVGDFDRDGIPDIAAAVFGGTTVAILLGVGDGTFPAAADEYFAGNEPHAITAGDFDGDGVLDLAVSNYFDQTITVLRGSANVPGSFVIDSMYETDPAGNVESLASADLDGDGNVDLVATIFTTEGPVSVFTGNGDATFNTAVDFPTGDDPRGITVADLDGDGRPDIVLADLASDTVSVLLNTTASVLRFSSATYAIPEGPATRVVTVTRTGALGASVTVQYATSNGTATAGEDYTAVAGTLSFGPGVTSLTFAVAILQDTLTEGAETINLTLSSPGGGAVLGTPSAAVLTIEANDVPKLQFSSATYAVSEGPATRLVTVTRSGGFGTSVTVRYATSNGTATAGQDYTPVAGTLGFGPNVTSLTFGVPILNDTLTEGAQTINLTLSSPGGGAVLGTRSAAVLTIAANDRAQLQFSSATYTTSEGIHTQLVTVARAGGFGTSVTVRYATSNGTAIAGQDYTAATGTLSFGPNVTSLAFGVAMLQDTLTEGAQTINLTLSSPGGGAVLGTQRTAVLTIIANDVPRLQFQSAAFAGAERDGLSTITVTRAGGFGTTVTVRYATSDGTAQAGVDYASTTGTLTFGPNDTTRTFAVTIVNDTRPEGAETVGLTLSSPGGGAVLGTPRTAVLTIAASD
jgi:hypothetical protein